MVRSGHERRSTRLVRLARAIAATHPFHEPTPIGLVFGQSLRNDQDGNVGRTGDAFGDAPEQISREPTAAV